jgi:long-subunit fatty acid transport protein
MKLAPVSRLRILTDLHWSNWSVDKANNFVFDQRIQLMRVAKLLGYTGGDYALVAQRNMKDTWHWGIGMEFDASERLTLRCGYEYRPTSTNPDLRDAIYFISGDMEYYGAGLTFKVKKGITLDFAVGYLFDGGIKAPNNSSTAMNSIDFTQIVYNPYAGLDYEQDTSLFAVAGGITMPLAVQMELIHNDINKVKKLLHILNPFK